MTVSLICGILLWAKRKEVFDHSRLFLSVFCFYVVGKLAFFLVSNMGDYLTEFSGMLFSPQLTIGGLFAISLFICYPIEVLRPCKLRGKWLTVLFLPSLFALLFLYILSFRELHSFNDLCNYIGDFDVLLRLLCVVMVAVISLLLLFIPYNWRKSSADYHWIRNTTIIALVLSVFFYIHVFTNSSVLNILHVIWGAYAIFHFTYYELAVRLQPPVDKESKDSGQVSVENRVCELGDTIDCWPRICQVMDEWEEWRNPNTTIDTVSHSVGTNRVYLARSIREHTGLTFNDYMNQKRINYMANQLRRDPQQDHKTLYFESGFRSRTSAYRNFVKFIGCSPTDFVSSL